MEECSVDLGSVETLGHLLSTRAALEWKKLPMTGGMQERTRWPFGGIT